MGAQPSNTGEALSVEATLGKERGRLLDFIRRRMGNASDAEDVLQDVFCQLLASDSVLEPIENLTAWLFTTARNKIIDWYRKRRSSRLWRGAGDEEGVPQDPVALLSNPADGPDRAYWRSAFWSELADALEELPEAQREVFVAHELEGRSFKEIAERTGEPINTLLSRKHYAVRGGNRVLLRSGRRALGGDDAALECPGAFVVQRAVGEFRPGPGATGPVAHSAPRRRALVWQRRLAARAVEEALRGEASIYEPRGARAVSRGMGPALGMWPGSIRRPGSHPSEG